MSSRGVTGVRGVSHFPYPRPLRLWAAPTAAAAAAAAVCGGVMLWREAAASGCGVLRQWRKNRWRGHYILTEAILEYLLMAHHRPRMQARQALSRSRGDRPTPPRPVVSSKW